MTALNIAAGSVVAGKVPAKTGLVAPSIFAFLAGLVV